MLSNTNEFCRHWLLSVMLVLGAAGFASFQGTLHAAIDVNTIDLTAENEKLIINLGDCKYGDVQTLAKRMATTGNGLGHKSGKIEDREFFGSFTAKKGAKLAVLSDDGTEISIKKTKDSSYPSQPAFAGLDWGQHLPDISQSLHAVSYTFLDGESYEIRVKYRNKVFITGGGDIDGVKLFLYDGGGKIGSDLSVEIVSIDKVFAPGVERMNLKYSIRPTGVTAVAAKLEVFKKGDYITPIYADGAIPKTGINIVYKQGGVDGWNGIAAGDYITVDGSKYEVRITVSKDAAYTTKSTASASTGVEVASVDVQRENLPQGDVSNRFLMNDPEAKHTFSARVKLKQKSGVAVDAPVPVKVSWSFVAATETSFDKSFDYDFDTKWLGKALHPDAQYWASDPTTPASSSDGFKRNASSTTTFAMGQSKAFIAFLPSGVGGDKYSVTATAKNADGSSVTGTPPAAVVWRRIDFRTAGLSEMQGVTTISDIFRDGNKLKGLFTPAYVEVQLSSSVTKLTADQSVEYIGLWQNEAANGHQKDWTVIQKKLAAETVDPMTRDQSNGIGATPAQQMAARDRVTAKAQAWASRIYGEYNDSLSKFISKNNLPDGLVGVKLIHPKVWSGDPNRRTTEWSDSPWLTIKSPENKTPVAPDGHWTDILATTVAPGGFRPIFAATVFVPRYVAADRLVPLVAHEIAHATRTWFYRQSFSGGHPDDHTPEMLGNGKPNNFGLMRPKDHGDKIFSDKERGVLAGKLVAY